MVVAYLSLNKRLNPFDEDFNRAALFFENFYRRIFWNSGKMCLKCGEKNQSLISHPPLLHYARDRKTGFCRVGIFRAELEFELL